jgi:predicted nucleic acid-binding protein
VARRAALAEVRLLRVLIDTNVALDWLLMRQPWFAEAEAFWQLLENGTFAGYIVASALTDIFYIARRIVGLEAARIAVQTSLAAFVIVPVDRGVLEEALLMPGNDYEDNLQLVCARFADLDAIVTRDPAGFRGATIPILSPIEVADSYRQTGR